MRNTTNVKHMQRVPHVHNQRIVRNDRYWCDQCNYAWPRSKFYANGKSPFSKESRFKDTRFASENMPTVRELKEFLVGPQLNAMKVPELKDKLLKRNPQVKGINKMRKADLVAALMES